MSGLDMPLSPCQSGQIVQPVILISRVERVVVEAIVGVERVIAKLLVRSKLRLPIEQILIELPDGFHESSHIEAAILPPTIDRLAHPKGVKEGGTIRGIGTEEAIGHASCQLVAQSKRTLVTCTILTLDAGVDVSL